MRVGIGSPEQYTGDKAFIGDDLAAMCARINTVFGIQHFPNGQHRPLPVCVVTHGAVQSHTTSAAYEAVQFNTNGIDTHGLHNTATDNAVFQIPVGGAGIYLCVATVTFAANATGQRYCEWRTDGNTVLATGDSENGNATYRAYVKPWAVIRVAAMDRIKLMAYQDSGGALNLGDTARAQQNQAAIIRIPWAV